MKRIFPTLLLSSALAVTTPAGAQFFGSSIVFDPSNYVQNLLTATRALQQVNNQIQQLQNEATMLQNMGKNLTSLSSSQLGVMVSSLTQISGLMNQAQGIALNVNATNTAFTQTYPQAYPSTTSIGTLQSDAHQRWQDAMSAFERTLQVQAQVAQNVQADAPTLSALVNSSQSAVGNLQVNQATNQLLALSIKQQLQIQNLMTAQDRATALDAARNAEAEESARAGFADFMGNGSAYTPQ